MKNYKKVTLGRYPQSKVSDQKTKKRLLKIAGEKPTSLNYHSWQPFEYIKNYEYENQLPSAFYQDISLDGEMYRGVIFLKFRSKEYRLNMTLPMQPCNQYFTNRIYWFKWEPIIWLVINDKNKEKTLLSEYIIESHQYHDKESIKDDENPDVINWLNLHFLRTSGLEDLNDPIDYEQKDFVKSKISIPSFEFISKYFEKNNPLRSAKTTDYACALGANTKGYCEYWVIDRRNSYFGFLECPDYNAKYNYSLVTDTGQGIRPCIISRRIHIDYFK